MHFSALLKPLLLAASAQAFTISIVDHDDHQGQELLQSNPAPTVDHCLWEGSAPFCAGMCPEGYTKCERDDRGDGAFCVTGYKVKCCTGKCPSANGKGLSHSSAAGKGDSPNDPHDDYCPPGKHILCPPGATKNEDCECFDDKSVGGCSDL